MVLTGLQTEALFKHLEDVHENDELEFKAAKGGLPHSFWETYSSFANTNGGLIVLGISEKHGVLRYDGIDDQTIDKLLKNLWSGVNNRNTVNINLLSNKDVEVYESESIKVIVVNVPRADRDQRPVYLGLDPYSGTYKRGYEGDFKCTRAEVQRMFADADIIHTFDKRILEGFTSEDIDTPSVKQYRQLFNIAKPDHVWSSLDDMSFLEKIGAYRKDRQTGKAGFTIAGMLMFGKGSAITDDLCVPYFFPDYRNETDIADGQRWIDRIYPDGTWEANLFQFYLRTLPRLQSILPKPFRLEGNQRVDMSPAQIAIREVFVNLCVHADYKAQGSLLVRFNNGTFIFSNPGDMLVSQEQFFEGGESICRNPTLQNMFMMLGPAEKAGSGGSKILEGWRYNNWRAPFIIQRYRPDKVEFYLPMESIMPKSIIDELDIRLGIDIKSLPSDYQLVLAVALAEKQISNERLRYILDLHKSEITILLQQMCKQKLLISDGYGRGTTYMLPTVNDSVDKRNPGTVIPTNVDTSTTNVDTSITNVDTSITNVDTSTTNVDTSTTNEDTSVFSERLQAILKKQRFSLHEMIFAVCEISSNWISIQQMAQLLHKDEKYLKNTVIPRLLGDGILEREFPLTPNHPSQRYKKSNG